MLTMSRIYGVIDMLMFHCICEFRQRPVWADGRVGLFGVYMDAAVVRPDSGRRIGFRSVTNARE
jgi:hypothetical protein